MAREAHSELMKAIGSGKFILTGEIQPKKAANFHDVLKAARALKGSVVACNVTDNARANAYLSSLVVSGVIQREVGLETVCQMTVRDRNRLALTSEILAAAALGIRNILTMSGDHTSLSDNPAAMPVYDLDTAQFVKMVRGMVDEGVDLAGNRIHGQVKLHVGIVGNPNSSMLDVELLKIERKIRLGADFMQTQIVFDAEKAKTFLAGMRPYEIPVLVGLTACRSHKMADFLSKNLPGILIPAHYMDALRRAEDNGDVSKRAERVEEVNLQFFSELVHEIRKTTHASGVHVMAMGYEDFVCKLAQRVL
jgi:5,10-methylenetetrahydrofolate reductase